MKLPTPLIILGTLVTVTVAVAFLGDVVGKRIGKRRVSVFGLRPRHTGILISVLTGVLILAISVGAMTVSSGRVRDALFRMDKLREEERLLRDHNGKLQRETERLLGRQKELQEELTQSKHELARRQAALGKAEADLASTDRLLTQARQDLQTRRKELAKVSAELEKGENVVWDQGRQILAQGQEVRALQKQQTDLQTAIARAESDIEELEQFRTELVGIARRAREGDVVYGANQLVGSAVVAGDQPEPQIRARLVRLLETAAREAREKGARPGKDGQRAVQVATRRVETADGPVYVWENQLLDSLAHDIHGIDDWLVELRALRNYVAGEQISVDVVLFKNQRVFQAGEAVLQQELNPNESEAQVFVAILGTIQQNLRKLSREKGMRPDTKGRVGDVSYEQIFRLLHEVKQHKTPVMLKVIAAEDAWTAGPLKVKFEVRPKGSG